MHMNKRAQGIIAMVVSMGVLLSVYFFYTNTAETPIIPEDTFATSTNNIIGNVNNTSKQNSAGNKTQQSRDLWSTFSLYLARAQDHDIQGVGELSFTLSDVCKDPKTKNECYKKMDTVYGVGSALKQEDFTHIVEDGKQGILSTDIRRLDTTSALVAIKQVIYFTKDAKGNPKLLALNPNEMWQIARNTASTTAELEAKLQSLIRDTDEDGVSDELENCIYPDNILQVSCKKTNPQKKDSIGDGWFDGIRPMVTQ